MFSLFTQQALGLPEQVKNAVVPGNMVPDHVSHFGHWWVSQRKAAKDPGDHWPLDTFPLSGLYLFQLLGGSADLGPLDGIKALGHGKAVFFII